MSIPTETDIEKRFPVWAALSELFLDTELDEAAYKYISKVVLDSGFEPEEIHDILWKEVFPAVGDNLRCVAGEWAGFDREWLKERILMVKIQESPSFSIAGFISVETLIDMTQQEWSKVCSHLPRYFSGPLLEADKEISGYKNERLKKCWSFW